MIEALVPMLLVVAYLGVAWLYRSKAVKYDLMVAIGIAAIAIALKVALLFTIADQSTIVLSLAMAALGVLMFLVLTYFTGSQVSGETILTVSATLAVSSWGAGIITYGAALVAIAVTYAYRTIKATGVNIKDLGLDIAHQTGVLDGKPIIGQNLIEAAEGAKRYSIVPAFFFTYLAGTAVVEILAIL